MNKNRKYTWTKDKLQERVRELELKVAKYEYQFDILKNILGVPIKPFEKMVDDSQDYVESREKTVVVKQPKIIPTITFTCSRCQKVQILESGGKKITDKIVDDYYGDICVPCASQLREEEERKQQEAEKQSTIPTPPPPVSQPTTNIGSTKEDFDKELKDTMKEGVKPSDVSKKKKKYIPPTGYGLDNKNQSVQQPIQETSTSMEQIEVRENAQGQVVCFCGVIATQVKKTADGKPEAFCAEHKEASDVEEKMKPADLKRQVAEASAKKYKVRTEELRPEIDCENCGKKNLDGYWNNNKTNNRNFCHDCYTKVFPEIVNPKCDACNKQDNTVGWFEALAKNYCEVCAKKVLDKVKK